LFAVAGFCLLWQAFFALAGLYLLWCSYICLKCFQILSIFSTHTYQISDLKSHFIGGEYHNTAYYPSVILGSAAWNTRSSNYSIFCYGRVLFSMSSFYLLWQCFVCYGRVYLLWCSYICLKCFQILTVLCPIFFTRR
jgi:hypothetical protein